jgi:UDP-N-acetylmuramoyl-L-alanyl-D-glutamate--2,6-diaminopimelate ligase
MAKSGDCILLMGKGHESGQEVNGVVTPFDDRIELLDSIRQVAK